MRGTTTPDPRKLRKNQTDAETTLWYRLRSRQIEGFKFRRQHQIGRYVVDFVCLENRLVVEVDGSQHIDSKSDEVRTSWLQEQGYRVLRFWNNDVLKDTEAVVEVIAEALMEDTPTPTLPPRGGGRDNATPLTPSPLVGDGWGEGG